MLNLNVDGTIPNVVKQSFLININGISMCNLKIYVANNMNARTLRRKLRPRPRLVTQLKL
ncbi:hypothetical protein HZS_1077 [Henneguya salminicola]|nr:hypothetical protein HZS_1077 [Henneguya salminicola]